MYFAILGHHLHLDFIIIFLLMINRVPVALRSAVLRYINILYLNTKQVFIYIYSSHETTKLDTLRLE